MKKILSGRKLFFILISFVLLYSFLSEFSPNIVGAQSVRTAKVEEIVGTVLIQKNGGAKSIRAYSGMILQQGDRISTNAFSSVKIVIQDTKDEITVDEKADLFIAAMNDEFGLKNTKFTIWSGSVWANVTTLVNSKDKFDLETPTSTMNVRGTHLLVGVDPRTGESIFYIASGVGQVRKNGQGAESGTIIYPNQQVTVDQETDDYNGNKNIADLENLISNTSNAIIEAIIASKAAIDQENDEYIGKLREEAQGSNQESIDRVDQNLQNLVGNLIKEAIKQNIVDELAIKKFIEGINAQLDKKLNLDNVKAPELSSEEKAKQEQLRLLEEERKKKQEQEKNRQEDLKKQNADLLNKMLDQLNKQKEQNEKALEEAKKKAEEQFKSKLDADSKNRLEEKQRALELEKQKQEAQAAEAKGKAESPAPNQTVPTPTKPTEEPAPSTVDRNLSNAKGTIPVSSVLYTSVSWKGILDALALPEGTNSEKIVKIDAIHKAVAELVEIPQIPEMNQVEVEFEEYYVRTTWAHVSGAVRYQVYLDDALEREEDELSESYSFANDGLVPGKSYKLEILALDENEEIIAKKVVDFQTKVYEIFIEDSSIVDDTLQISWDGIPSADRYELYINNEPLIDLNETSYILTSIPNDVPLTIVVKAFAEGFDFPIGLGTVILFGGSES